MRLEDLRALSIFDGLTDQQLTELLEAGEEHEFVPDEVLFHEGHPADSWWVLLEGTVSLVRQVGKEETTLGAMTQPGQWAGGFRAWDEHGVYFATGRATSSGRVFAVSATVLRERADAWFPFGVHFIKGLVNTVRGSRRGPDNASRWWLWAPWPPVWLTRSTTRPRPPPGRSTPWRAPPSR